MSNLFVSNAATSALKDKRRAVAAAQPTVVAVKPQEVKPQETKPQEFKSQPMSTCKLEKIQKMITDLQSDVHDLQEIVKYFAEILTGHVTRSEFPQSVSDDESVTESEHEYEESNDEIDVESDDNGTERDDESSPEDESGHEMSVHADEDFEETVEKDEEEHEGSEIESSQDQQSDDKRAETVKTPDLPTLHSA